MHYREDTFRIDYAKVSKKPGFEEVFSFVRNELDMKREEVKRIQLSKFLGCVFVKTSGPEVAHRVVKEHDDKHEHKVDDTVFKLRITLEDGAVDVKVHDLSEGVPNENIVAFLSVYGEVKSIRDDIWDEKYIFGGIPSGIRIVRMRVKQNIPSFVTIDGEGTLVSYAGQKITCRYCGDKAHNGISCVQNRKLKNEKLNLDNQSKSYASAVQQRINQTIPLAVQSEQPATGKLLPANLLNFRSKPQRSNKLLSTPPNHQIEFKIPTTNANTTSASNTTIKAVTNHDTTNAAANATANTATNATTNTTTNAVINTTTNAIANVTTTAKTSNTTSDTTYTTTNNTHNTEQTKVPEDSELESDSSISSNSSRRLRHPTKKLRQ